MKTNKLWFLIITFIPFLSCNPIPDKSVFDKLSADELAKIIEEEPDFVDLYEQLSSGVNSFNEVEKAKYRDITYRGFYDYYKFTRDTTFWIPVYEKWEVEWNEKYGSYNDKVDSVLDYWTEYKAANSLDRFVKIEFYEIDKDYYSYSGDVKDVNLGFTLTPIANGGTIEQVKFQYRYSAKINKYYGEWKRCISTTPIYYQTVRYWEVNYSDKDLFERLTTASFKRDYDLEIMITDVRYNGKNYSENDLDIPKSVKNVFDTDEDKYPYLYNSYREDVIKEILCKSYQRKYEYYSEQEEIVLNNKYPREYAFVSLLRDKDD